MKERVVFSLFLALQLICASVFLWEMMSSLFGLSAKPISWALYEIIEILAGIGLILGVVMAALLLRQSTKAKNKAEASLRLASGAFMDVLNERFAEWGLTPAERDVALFSIKGLSTADIAALRQTSEGTVKAQTNAIYRKAGVTGRPQLLSLFIDALMDDQVTTLPATSDDAA